MNIRELLALAVKEKASDIHLTVGAPPVFRVNGELVSLRWVEEGGLGPCLPGTGLNTGDEARPLSIEEIEHLVEQLTGEERLQQFCRVRECDFAYGVPGLGRFRINCFRQRGSPAVAIRVLNDEIPSLVELGLPETVAGLIRRSSGLVVVTGPAGSGKSTTLAAMVDLINQERCCHVITLEDPIEYLHCHKCSIVNQREIGDDAGNFAGALRAALREDPDVILVGEMRDAETTAITLTAAETGHLVLATMHTPNAALTIDRIVDAFPPHQEGRVRMQLSRVLQGIVAQQLFPRSDKKGRVVAAEVFVVTPSVQSLIREGKTYQIPSVIQTGARHGMQSFAQSLKDLHSKGLITREEMVLHVHDTELLR
ncbi:MAG: type IV pilus twitching motility protein PilT [Bacillota bacterium]